jgi:lipoate-protein ligase A
LRFGPSLSTSHRVVGEAIAAALAHLGITSQLSRPSPSSPLLERPCFVSAGRAEILVGGRKLVGSAQRRTSGAFLQHGSLLLGPAHVSLVDLLHRARRRPEHAAAMRQQLQQSTTHVQELLGRRPSFAEMSRALVRGFCSRLQLEAVGAPVQSS